MHSKKTNIIISQLFDSSDLVRNNALDEILIFQIPPSEEITNALKKVIINDIDIYIRCKAASVLFQVDNNQRFGLDFLTCTIHDPIDENVICSLGYIEELGEAASSAIPDICNIILNHSNSEVRLEALETIQNMRSSIPEILPVLLNAMDDSNSDVRQAAVVTIGMSKPLSSVIVILPNIIIKLIDENEPEVIDTICFVLKKTAKISDETRIYLKNLLKSEVNKKVREAVHYVLDDLDSNSQ